MLDLIMEGRVFDFGYLHDQTGLASMLSNLVPNKISNVASTYASKVKLTQRYLDTLIEEYALLEEKLG